MPSNINGTELLENPIDTIFSPFTSLIGDAFWLITISVIAAALYVRTKSITVVGAWLLGAGMFMSAANLFSEYPSIIDFYLLIVVIGIGSLILGILLDNR